jgi:hypothetical protein
MSSRQSMGGRKAAKGEYIETVRYSWVFFASLSSFFFSFLS